MTTQVSCEIYYSIAGEPFGPEDLHTNSIAHVSIVLYIYTRDQEEMARGGETSSTDVVTELSVTRPIKKGPFFNSESYCLFRNEAGAVLKVDGQSLFKIHMMRDGQDHERLHVKFDQQYFPGEHQWVDIAGEDQPKAPPIVL